MRPGEVNRIFDWSSDERDPVDFELSYLWPEQWKRTHMARAIGYSSDKREVGQWQQYIHTFGSGVYLYQAVGAPDRGRPVRRFRKHPANFDFLAWALDLELQDERGNVFSVDFAPETVLGWWIRQKALVIAHPGSYPLIVAGGRLDVEERGIVH